MRSITALQAGFEGPTRYDMGTNETAPGGASTPLIQGPRRSEIGTD